MFEAEETVAKIAMEGGGQVRSSTESESGREGVPRPDLGASAPLGELGLSVVCDRKTLKVLIRMSCIINSSPVASVLEMEWKRISGQCNSFVQAYKGPNAKTCFHSNWSYSITQCCSITVVQTDN